MSADRLRGILIALLAVAGVVSVVAKKADDPWLGWVSFVIFLVAVGFYFRWRQAVRARVFAREAKTPDESRPSPDQ